MVVSRRCAFRMPNGEACRAAPMRESTFCLFHDPAHAAEAQEARRLGGLRRKREVAVAAAYGFDGLESVPQIRRLLEVAALDTLALDNGIPRARTLVAVAQAASKLLEVG